MAVAVEGERPAAWAADDNADHGFVVVTVVSAPLELPGPNLTGHLPAPPAGVRSVGGTERVRHSRQAERIITR